ncbi:hypothetical protein PsexTeo8_02720 [Pseudomonas extremaustralis]|nr:hypothetical protein [Pseudomonas extremaustralis]
MFGDERIDLDKEYDFRVSVEGLSGSFSAELKLSPKAITIRISGDQLGVRSWGETKWELEYLECSGIRWSFILFDLHCIRSGTYFVGEDSFGVAHFEAEYTAGYAIASRAEIKRLEFSSIHIYSSSLAKWVGYTEKQQEIIDNQIGGSRVGLVSGFDDFDTTEFLINYAGEGQIGVNYNINGSASPFNFEVGVRFPPSFCLFSKNNIRPEDSMHLYQKTYSLLSMLYGSELSVERIELWGDSSINREANLYYPRSELSSNALTSYCWYPLSQNLRFNDLGIPPFPFAAISKYFSSDYELPGTWLKYIKYRRRANIEERFLGYFRLLELLTKNSKSYLDPCILRSILPKAERVMSKIFGSKKEVKGFLKGIERYNNSKYNTEKCILDFYKRLPIELTGRWSLDQKGITAICKLRNDISHANDYFESEFNLLIKCAFVESLLLIFLLETLGVPISISSKMIVRLPGAYVLYQ